MMHLQIIVSAGILHTVITFLAEILAEIRKNGFEKPSIVQSEMWPTLLDGTVTQPVYS